MGTSIDFSLQLNDEEEALSWNGAFRRKLLRSDVGVSAPKKNGRLHHGVRSAHRSVSLPTTEDEAVFWIVWGFVFTICCTCCWRCFPKSVFRGSHRGRGGGGHSGVCRRGETGRGDRRGAGQANARPSNRAPSSSSLGDQARHQSQRLSAREDAATEEEEALLKNIKRMEAQLAATKLKRQVATARAAAAESEVELTEAQDEKGRALYGEAWDEPQDGGVPLKELFTLNEEELREIKIEAYNRMAAEEKKLNTSRGTTSARLGADTRGREGSAPNNQAAPNARGHGQPGSARRKKESKQGDDARRRLLNPYEDDDDDDDDDGELDAFVLEQEERAAIPVTARTSRQTHRSHRPKQGAPYDDPRFVHPRPNVPVAQPPPKQAHRQPPPPPYPPPSYAAQPLVNGDEEEEEDGATYAPAAHVPPPLFTPLARSPLVMVQAPGLTNPKPPPLPPPGLSAQERARRSDSAFVEEAKGEARERAGRRNSSQRRGV